MNRYEYVSPYKKTKEKLLALSLFFLALALFLASRVEGIVFPVLPQLVSVAVFTVFVFLVAKSLVRNYVYAVEPDDDGTAVLTVTEHYGRRVSVRARITLTEITSVQPMTRENRREIRAAIKGKVCYSFYPFAFATPDRCVVSVDDGEERYSLIICADAHLTLLLISH